MLSPEFHRRIRYIALPGMLLLAVLFVLVQRNALLRSVEEGLAKARDHVDEGKSRQLLRESGRLDAVEEGRMGVLTRRSELWDLTPWQGELWGASGGGLLRWPRGGASPRSYDIRHGLPENRLRAIRAVGDRLFCATASRGLVVIRQGRVMTLDGLEGPAASIRRLHVDGRELFVGSHGAGVSRWTEEGLRFYGPPGDENRALRVTCLAGRLGSLAVGSFSRGLHLERDGAWTVVEPEKLGGGEVLALAPWKGGWAVGTATGLYGVDSRGGALRIIADGLFVTALHGEADTLWVGTLGSGILRIGTRGRQLQDRQKGGRGIACVYAFSRSDEGFFAATKEGLLAWDGKAWQAGQLEGDELAENHVSALALDGDGRLWIGTFRSGIEVWTADLSRCLHRFRDERIREINGLAWDGLNGCMWAATSAGALSFRGFEELEFLDEEAGLLSSSVMAIRPERDRLLFATGAGLSWRLGGRIRSLSTFHGLVSNNCYTLATVGGELWVGSLGGISRIRNDRVAGRITALDSALRRNWVTAMIMGTEGLYVGSYGGGLARRDLDGTIRPLAPELGDFEVNFNALLLLPGRLLAGTLDEGVAIVDRSTGRGRFVLRDCGTANVTAMATSAPWLYIGSDGGVTRTLLSRFD